MIILHIGAIHPSICPFRLTRLTHRYLFYYLYIRGNNNLSMTAIKKNISRADFLRIGAAAAGALAMSPIVTSCHALRGCRNDNRSNIKGVQMGVITYSFRDMPSSSAGDTLLYTLGAGLGSVELMGGVADSFAHVPPMQHIPRRGQENGTIPQHALQHDEMRMKSPDDFKPDYEAYTRLAELYRRAGVGIHILKYSPSAAMTDAQLDHIFAACRAIGAIGVTTELSEETAERVAPFAEKYDRYLIFHNHFQAVKRNWHGYDTYLRYSPKIMINFDAGHYFGCTGNDPCDIIREYHNHIVSIHVKDKTSPRHGNRSKPWGEGEMPLPQLFDLVASNAGRKGWPVHCDIELEYRVPQGSSPVEEVARCLDYARACITG